MDTGDELGTMYMGASDLLIRMPQMKSKGRCFRHTAYPSVTSRRAISGGHLIVTVGLRTQIGGVSEHIRDIALKH